MASAAALMLTVGQWLVPGTPAVAATVPAWNCPAPDLTTGYAFEKDKGSGPHEIQEIDPRSHHFASVAMTPQAVDAVGFNELDHYFYGVLPDHGSLVRIGADGSLETVRSLTAPLPEAGDIDPQGHYWVAGGGQWREYDLDPGSGAFGSELAGGTLTVPGGLTAPGDWSYMSTGPYGPGLYGVAAAIGGGQPHLVYFSTTPADGHLVDIGQVYGDIPTDGLLGTFTDGAFLYVQAHGAVYRVDMRGQYSTRLFDTGIVAGDGAQCGRQAAADLTLTKVVKDRNNPGDQFKIAAFDADWNLLDSNETQGQDDQVRIGPVRVLAGQVYYLFDELRNDYFPPDPGLYHADAQCFENGVPVPVHGGPGRWEVIPQRAGELDCHIVNLGVGQSRLDVHKMPDRPVGEVGEVVHYVFHVVNTGDRTLQKVRIDDPENGAALDCPLPPEGLPPGQGVDCGVVPRQIRPEDADRGVIENHAKAVGVDTRGDEVSAEAYARVDVIRPKPEIALVKSVTPETVTAAHQTVTYTYRVENRGTVPLENVKVQEHRFTGSGTNPSAVCPIERLDPGAGVDCTSVYTVTQQDIDAGEILNAATATGMTSSGDSAESEPSQARVEASRTPRIALAKTSAPLTVSSVGEPVRYEFTVHNTGNTTLRDIVLEDSAFTGHAPLEPLDCGHWDHTLAPGAEVTCSAGYTVAQGDIDQGGIANTADVTGHTPDGTQTVKDSASHTVTATRTAGLSLVKQAEPATTESFKAGQVVVYTYEVRNTGTTTVNAVTVVETQFTGSGTKPTPTCAKDILEQGERTVCSTTYTLTPADITQGTVANTAHATGTSPVGPATSNEASVVLEGPPAIHGLEIVKTVEPATVTAAAAEVTYSFKLTNTGTSDLHAVGVTENQFTGTAGPLAVTCPAATLAAGGTMTCTAHYHATQADIDEGTVTNTATAHALEPGGSPVGSLPSTAVLHTTGAAALRVVKHPVPAVAEAPGALVTYEYTVTNTGTVTVLRPHVLETGFGGSGAAPVAVCPQVRLAPGESTECTASYILTAADFAAGRVVNTAHAEAARADDGDTVRSDNASATVTVPSSSLSLVKTATPKRATTGDTVTYSYRVTNTGGTLLHSVRVTETAFTGRGTAPVPVCPANELAVGATIVCKATYKVTAADTAAGHVDNTAVAQGITPGGATVSANASSRVRTEASKPSLPATGAEVLPFAGLGAALSAVGGAALLGTRRRRRL